MRKVYGFFPIITKFITKCFDNQTSKLSFSNTWFA